jgi:DNA-binding MarR family transcriptional regulator
MWLWRAGLLVSFVTVVLLAPNVYSQLSATNYLNSEASAGETMSDDMSFNAQPTNDSSSQESSQDSEQQSESGEDESSTTSSEEEDQSKSSDDSAEPLNSDSPPSESTSFAADETGQANDNNPTYSKFDLSDDNLKLGGASLATSFIISSAGFALLLEGVKISMIITLFGPLLAKKYSGESGTLTKGRILGYIEAHPGIHFSALRDGLSLANGATSHHLHNLEREGKIISWSDGRRTRYAIPSIDPTTLNTLKHPATAVQKSILNALENNFDDGLSSTELRNRLECTRQLLAYHLGSLSGRQFIERKGKGRKTIWQISIKGQQHMEILQKTG